MKRFFTYIFAAALLAAGCEQHCEVDDMPGFRLSSEEFNIGSEGETVSVDVVSKLNWTAASDADWITVRVADIASVDGRTPDGDFAASADKPFNSDLAGGRAIVEFAVSPNPYASERAGTITFALDDRRTFIVQVSQSAGSGNDDDDNGDDNNDDNNGNEDDDNNNGNDDFPEDMELMFPDPIFRAYVLENFDTDGNGKISQEEAEAVTQVGVYNFARYDESKCIKSLEGIQYFTNLTNLTCDYNRLTTLDVRKNTQLEYLSCSNNQISTLDVSNNVELNTLRCYSNKLTSMDVSKNTQLTWLDCGGNQLTTLDVSLNVQLEKIECPYNQLTSLDVSRNIGLTWLSFSDNLIASLDVGNNTQLTYLNCIRNQLTVLDVSKNTQLKRLYCNSNQLTNLDLNENTQLYECTCHSNQFMTLDVSKTNLGSSPGHYIFNCSDMPTLKTLYLKKGWSIKGVTEDNGRSETYIPEQTEIIYVD